MKEFKEGDKVLVYMDGKINIITGEMIDVGGSVEGVIVHKYREKLDGFYEVDFSEHKNLMNTDCVHSNWIEIV